MNNLNNTSMGQGSLQRPCPTCKGRGIVQVGTKGQTRDCPHCGGKGSGFAKK